MMDALSDKVVKLRKPCKCAGCLREFKEGQSIRKLVTVGDDGFSSTAWCEVCDAYWSKYMSNGDEISEGQLKDCDPEIWEALRKEIETVDLKKGDE